MSPRIWHPLYVVCLEVGLFIESMCHLILREGIGWIEVAPPQVKWDERGEREEETEEEVEDYQTAIWETRNEP